MIVIKKRYVWATGKDTSFVNLFSLGEMKESLSDEELAHFDFYADGIALVKAIKLLRHRQVDRVSFDDTSLAPRIFQRAVADGLSVALIGGTAVTAEKVKETLEEKYPGLALKQAFAGYFDSPQERQHVIDQACAADIVIVGMGGGLQEQMLLALRRAGWTGTGFTCGGYFDQLLDARGGSYYPEFYNKHNLRWLYRLKREPGRLLKRYFAQYPARFLKYMRYIK